MLKIKDLSAFVVNNADDMDKVMTIGKHSISNILFSSFDQTCSWTNLYFIFILKIDSLLQSALNAICVHEI